MLNTKSGPESKSQPVHQKISFACSVGYALVCYACLLCAVKQLTWFTLEELHAIIGKSFFFTVKLSMALKCFEIPFGRRKLT